jgi:hypothetical protein
MNGFTHRGTTGTPVGPGTIDEFEGLNPSAVAVARTVSAARLQMREKKVGRFAFCTVTVTFGFTLNAAVPLPGNNKETSVVCTWRAAILRLMATL